MSGRKRRSANRNCDDSDTLSHLTNSDDGVSGGTTTPNSHVIRTPPSATTTRRSSARNRNKLQNTNNNEHHQQQQSPKMTLRKRHRPPKLKHPFLVRNLGQPVNVYDDEENDDREAEISFQLIMLNSKQNPFSLVQIRADRRCPFCHFQVTSNKHMFRHCERFHGDQHTFEEQQKEDGTTLIMGKPNLWRIARPRKGDDIAFVRFRATRSSSSSSLVKATKRKKRQKVVPHLRADGEDLPNPPEYGYSSPVPYPRRGESFKPSANTPSPMRPAKGLQQPKRQYYHSRSRLAMQPGEWEIDSDDGSDNGWLDELAQAGLNEFVDITVDEKRFLNLWKRSIRSDVLLADDVVPTKCISFIRDNIDELRGLRQQLLMHMMTLWEHRLVPSDHILVCMKEFDKHHPPASSCGNTTTAPSTALV